MPPQITCASALPGKTEKQRETRIFTQMLYQCIAWIQPAVSFLQSFWLTTHTDDAVWLPINHAVNAFSPQDCWVPWFRRKEVENAAGVGLCCTHSAPVRCLLAFLFRNNAEALESWGGNTKYRLISYFLSSTSAKNYRNWIVYVKTIASQRWDVFETRCILGSITARHSSSGRQRNFAAFSRAITLGIGLHSSYGRPM